MLVRPAVTVRPFPSPSARPAVYSLHPSSAPGIGSPLRYSPTASGSPRAPARGVEVLMRLDVCVRAFALAAAAGLLAPASARGQTYTWNQPATGGDWLSVLNWSGGGTPTAAGTVASFGGV